MISHRVGAFGCYIVCALLFQRFLENDHHVSAHAGLMGLLLLLRGWDGGTISGGAVRCEGSRLQECTFNPAQIKSNRGHVRQRSIRVAQHPQLLSLF